MIGTGDRDTVSLCPIPYAGVRKNTPASPAMCVPRKDTMTEKEFQARVIQVAKIHRWLVYHPYDSRRSTPGFPDLVLVKDSRVWFRELKTDKGRLTDAQKLWGERLIEAGQDYAVWRPAERTEIFRTLSRN